MAISSWHMTPTPSSPGLEKESGQQSSSRTLPNLPLMLILSLVGSIALTGMGTALGVPTTTLLVASAVGVAVAGWWSRPAPSLLIGLIAFLAYDGFTLNRQGDLSWSASADAAPLALLLMAALLPAAARNQDVRDEHRQP